MSMKKKTTIIIREQWSLNAPCSILLHQQVTECLGVSVLDQEPKVSYIKRRIKVTFLWQTG